ADTSRSRPAVVGASGTFVTASAWKYSTLEGGKKLMLSMAAAVKDTPAVSVTVLVDPVYADTTPNPHCTALALSWIKATQPFSALSSAGPVVSVKLVCVESVAMLVF